MLSNYHLEEDGTLQLEGGNPFESEVLRDYWICCVSREVSILARKEVLGGKAKFGIVGDGKELAQVALAKVFRAGDFRSGYYRDQTLMFALNLCSIEDYFAQLYADPDHDPFSGGRQMNAHFASPLVDPKGNWLEAKHSINISSDISPTGGQMARALGLALASKKYRSHPHLTDTLFSRNGNEISFCTIGDASTSEGVFWETINAAGVQQVPLFVTVWDDGYGISVPIDYQTTKKSISAALAGFQSDVNHPGVQIQKVKGWDYPALCLVFANAAKQMRATHEPALIHVQEVTQPQGHSTSGSHERYKDAARLQWEKDYDCIHKLSEWMVQHSIASQEQLDTLRAEARNYVKRCKDKASQATRNYINQAQQGIRSILAPLDVTTLDASLGSQIQLVQQQEFSGWAELVDHVRKISRTYYDAPPQLRVAIQGWLDAQNDRADRIYHHHLYVTGKGSALNVLNTPPEISESSPEIPGYEILNRFFDMMLERYPQLYAFGEDVGKIGDVNQGFAGLQQKYSEDRVFDTGIREWTIAGQAIGMAMRGLRPIAEIQYLDYLLYCIEPLSDDLATLLYRSNGLQRAPAIFRSRGHRLEGVWHSGSPMGVILHALRGMYVCVPRNMTQAAGMYHTLLQCDEPALVIECLNGYRLREKLPENIGTYTVPMGVPEILRSGSDATLVTYGSCVRIAMEACQLLEAEGIEVELIDVQTLLPFDIHQIIGNSLQKTNRLCILDEDVSGGATGFMLQKILEEQNGYRYLDASPTTLHAADHRPPYGSDGDYFSKPQVEDVYDSIMKLVSE